MHNYLDLSLIEINKLLKEKKITPKVLVEEAFEKIENNKDLNCFITLNKEEALKQAEELKGKEVDSPKPQDENTYPAIQRADCWLMREQRTNN